MTVPYTAVLHDASMPPRRETTITLLDAETPLQWLEKMRDHSYLDDCKPWFARCAEEMQGLCKLLMESTGHVTRLQDQNAALRAEVVRLTAALDDTVRPELERHLMFNDHGHGMFGGDGIEPIRGIEGPGVDDGGAWAARWAATISADMRAARAAAGVAQPEPVPRRMERTRPLCIGCLRELVDAVGERCEWCAAVRPVHVRFWSDE